MKRLAAAAIIAAASLVPHGPLLAGARHCAPSPCANAQGNSSIGAQATGSTSSINGDNGVITQTTTIGNGVTQSSTSVNGVTTTTTTVNGVTATTGQ